MFYPEAYANKLITFHAKLSSSGCSVTSPQGCQMPSMTAYAIGWGIKFGQCYCLIMSSSMSLVVAFLFLSENANSRAQRREKHAIRASALLLGCFQMVPKPVIVLWILVASLVYASDWWENKGSGYLCDLEDYCHIQEYAHVTLYHFLVLHGVKWEWLLPSC